ncbi:unnamed protein product [Linum trigynum]|uniref:Uncharacterized protein n=1 Tax=Linum trigynum TaxID=586398 RepID=A0AAV2EAH4_9ROSI
MSRRNNDDLSSLVELMRATLAPQGLPAPPQKVGEVATGAKEAATTAITTATFEGTTAAQTGAVAVAKEPPGSRDARLRAEGGEHDGGAVTHTRRGMWRAARGKFWPDPIMA